MNAEINISDQKSIIEIVRGRNLMVVAHSKETLKIFMDLMLKQMLNSKGEGLIEFGFIGSSANCVDDIAAIPSSSLYKGIRTDYKLSRDSLLAMMNQLIGEFETRYQQLKTSGAQNIHAYNLMNDMKIPDLWIVINDYADLINVYGYEFSSLLGRLAVMGKLIAMHIVIATTQDQKQENNVFVVENFHDKIILSDHYLKYLPGIPKSWQGVGLTGNGDALHVRSGKGIRTQIQRLEIQ